MFLASIVFDEMTLDNPTFDLRTDGVGTFKFLEVSGSISEPEKSVKNLTILDPIYADATSRTQVETAIPMTVDVYGPVAKPGSEFRIKWTTTIHVKDSGNNPQVGASVTIEDVNTTEVFSGTTDGSGNVVAVVTESLHESTGITNYNTHTAYGTSGPLAGNTVFTADAVKTVTVTVT